ncbi:MAG TPA: hypothetical protein VN086_00915 [Candidatus Paceibacterota bacterium]|nr:hypothetical protein [Candidatus Paceibacterota bacterium]
MLFAFGICVIRIFMSAYFALQYFQTQTFADAQHELKLTGIWYLWSIGAFTLWFVLGWVSDLRAENKGRNSNAAS